MKSKRRLGEVLRARGKISQEDLQKAVSDQHGKMIHLGELLLDRGLVSKTDIAAALEEASHVTYLDCSNIVSDPEALEMIPRTLAESSQILPIRFEGGRLVVAMADPQNLTRLSELRFKTGKEIEPRLAFRSELREAIRRLYFGSCASPSAPVPVESAVQSSEMHFQDIEFFSSSSRQSNQEAIIEAQADLRQRKTPAVRLVSEIIQIAISKQASDIHIEPRSAETAIRIRVDGVLRDLRSVPRNIQNSLISRVKILADMDIAERRAPQDGRLMVNVGNRQIDLRVSTLPTQYGEKIVIRLLETNASLLSLADLGMPADMSSLLVGLLSQPQGMILVTGPTGSGKSTTLYGSLNILRKPSVNIVTVEDPVEYVLPGINQAQVNAKTGLTFASCLRSILRQDPNIIMVGEIRDRETAEIAMKAAQTGHLVLSSLHTNDSASAVVRLLDLGIPGFLISSSVSGILAQRLVRKLCTCKSEQDATTDFQARMVQAGVLHPPKKMLVPGGCDKCDFTGYKGRVGIFEMLRFDEAIRTVLRTSARTDEITSLARSGGMRMMQESALDKIEAGLTTLDEVLRIVPFDAVSHTSCLQCNKSVQPDFRYCPHCGILRHLSPTSHRADRPADQTSEEAVLRS